MDLKECSDRFIITNDYGDVLVVFYRNETAEVIDEKGFERAEEAAKDYMEKWS